MEGLMVVGRLTVFLALTLGTPLVWLALLNLRDRRQASVLHAVLREISSRELLGRVAVRVRCGVLSRRCVATVSILACSRNEIWEIMARLSGRLSPQVRLEVTGPVDRQFLATFTVKTTSGPPLLRRVQPFLATN